ncbi:MAG TPA: DUF481 domain-containing protein [Vicinamibacterales bacterium]
MLRALLATVLIALCAREAFAGHGKIDLVELDNGDEITCEVTSLKRGMVTAETDALGTISIEWDKVRRIVSPAQFEIELSSGDFLFGTLDSAAAGSMTVHTQTGDVVVTLLQVVRLSPLEAGFWQRLDGAMDLGFSFAQADALTQWTLNSTVSRHTPKYFTQATLNSIETIDDTDSRQSRNTLSVQTQRSLGNRWFFAPLLQISQNEQLGLDLRTVLSAGVGRYLVQSNNALFSLTGGVTYTRERFAGEPTDDRSEAVGGITWEWFTFGDSETNLSNAFLIYENLGSAARTRIELTTSFRRKFFKDFYWSINLVESFDSAPPDNQKKNDLSTAIALGWSF